MVQQESVGVPFELFHIAEIISHLLRERKSVDSCKMEQKMCLHVTSRTKKNFTFCNCLFEEGNVHADFFTTYFWNEFCDTYFYIDST